MDRLVIEHTRKWTYILCLLILSLALVVARSLVHTNGQALDNHQVSKPQMAALRSEQITVRAAGRGNPYLNLRDGHDLLTTYVGKAAPVQILQQHQAHPTSLTSADFDEDGVPDLVSGYSSSGRGLLGVYRGNVDSVYPNAPEAKQRKAEGSFVDSPFFPSARVFETPESVDFIGAGDFDSDGHWDVVTAAREGVRLHLFSGNGRGNLNLTKSIQLPGAVTALVAGEINRRDGLTDLAVGILGVAGPQALVFESPLGALRGEPEVFPAPAEVTTMAMGQLDDEYTLDLAVGAGVDLLIIRGRDRKLSLDELLQTKVPPAVITKHSFESAITSTALGDFTGKRRKEIAVLLGSAEVKVISFKKGKSKQLQQRNLLLPDNWKRSSYLVRAKVSSLPQDDLVFGDEANHQIHILGGEKEKESVERVATSLHIDSESMAVLPMQLNIDTLQDLVVLKKGQNNLTVAMTAPMSTFVVNSTGDGNDCDVNDGVCSLGTVNNGQCVLTNVCTYRAAIQQANASAGLDAISFSIGSGPQTITPLTGLPVITSPAIIDGTTQTGYAGSPIIELNGASAGASVRGVTIAAGSSTIKGLVINRWGGAGIFISSNGGNTIQSTFIGTDVTGTAVLGNSADGVAISSANNTIGGTVAGARNVISGNNVEGINFFRATGNLVQGNLIGIDVTGTANLGNYDCGVLIHGGASDNTIGGTVAGSRNVISGNKLRGILTVTGASGNLVQGNLIGTDVTGTADLGNAAEGDGGVRLTSANNTIGGTVVSARNVISGNDSRGISIAGFAGFATGNLVQGNLIGTDVTGTADLGNSSHGVWINSVDANTIGGTVAGARNVISGNSEIGILISFNGATRNTVQGNYIGTDANGTSGLPNNGHGISVTNSASNNTIGGTTSNAGNKIQNNGGDGVFVASGTGNAIVGNSISSNAGLGIDLGPDGVTNNDTGDVDPGANNLQNFPVLDSIFSSNSSTTISGTLTSRPTTAFTLHFYSNDQCDASGSGEGHTPMGIAGVTTNAAGKGIFKVSFSTVLSSTQVVTATATDAGNNSSEFSACSTVFKGDGDSEFKVSFQRAFENHRQPIGFQHIPSPALLIKLTSGRKEPGNGQLNAFATLAAGENVKIELSRDGGSTFETLFASTPNDGSECWLVTGPTTTRAVIRVSSTDNPAVTGSSEPFEIVSSAGGSVLTALNFGTEYCGDLGTGDSRSQIRGSSFYADRYFFSGSMGQQIAITLSSPVLDTYLYLLGPDGSVIAQDNDGGGATDARLPATSGFLTLLATGTYVIEATSFVPNTLGGYQFKLDSGPLLLTAENTQRAIALDSVTMIRDPFPLSSIFNLSPDHRTRVSLFAVNLDLLPGESISAVKAQAEDSQRRIYPLTVEYVGNVPNFGWLTQINVRLPDELATAGDVWVSTSLRGVVGNRALINIR